MKKFILNFIIIVFITNCGYTPLYSVKNNNVNFNRLEVLKDLKFYIYLPSYLTPPFVVTGLLFYQIHIAIEKSWSLELLALSYVFYGLLCLCYCFFIVF